MGGEKTMRSWMLAVGLLGLGAGPAAALEIKNVRNCYMAPFAGATRPDLKILGGELIFITYDVEGLKVSDKGKVSFSTNLELLDSAGKQIYSKDTPAEVFPQLGGNRVPGEIRVTIPFMQTPGKYNIKVTITDMGSKDKETKSFLYPFEVRKDTFGIMRVSAQGIGFVGAYHLTEFVLVNMKLDAKNEPNMELVMRVLDASGKELSKLMSSFPKDLPPDVDLGKANFLPWHYPIYLNRAGRFTVEISAKDLAGGAAATTILSFTVEVIDPTAVLSK